MAIDPLSESTTSRYRKRFAQLRSEVDNDWRSHWLELSEYVLPRKGRYLSTDSIDKDAKGSKVNQKILNGTTCDALRVIAAGMQGGLTSPARPWFRLTLPDVDLMEYKPVRQWLDLCASILLNTFQKSNFYSSIHSVYEELSVFGTNAILIEEDFLTGVRFRPFTIGEYFLALGPDYRPNTMYRRFSMTARQLVKMFGKANVSSSVLKQFEDNAGETRFPVIHVIQPNFQLDPAVGGPPGMAYESVYFEEMPGRDAGEEEKVLRRGGYRDIPFAAPRWHVTATEVYGRSPGMDALGDVKMLQKMEAKKLRALDKLVDPPMNAPTAMKREGNPTVLPGGVNFVDTSSGQQGFAPTYQIQPDFRAIGGEIQNVENRIKRFFFNDMFLAIITQGKRMTATEVAERHEEKLMMLGPVLERLQSELLNVVIERTFGILSDLGLMPPAPAEMANAPIRVEYTSLLAQAQKMVGTSNIEQFIAFTANLSAAQPAVWDKVDANEVVDEYGNMLGVPARIIRSDDEVAQIQAAREQQQRQQQALATAQIAAKGAKDLAGAQMGTGSALDAVMAGQPK